MEGNILIIDDEDGIRKLLSRIIRLEGFSVDEAATIKAGHEVLKKKSIDVVLCDVKLPDGNGVAFVKELKATYPLTEIILLTAYGNIADGVQAIKNGGFDYITKGNDNDRILPLLNQAMDKVQAQKKAAVRLKESGTQGFENVIGNSAVIKQIIAFAKKIAPTDAPVLLLGETGTGKEIFANAIHAQSKRAAAPFMAINCSAFNKELLEGELFGHKAGAYTGAAKDKKGLIELVHEGTLFLDEVGDMNSDLQAKLLRVLENGEFIKLGDVKTTKVDVRLIAATNRNLEKDMAAGLFREDLFYRLNVFNINLPPLRERAEDIPLLATYFLNQFTAKEGRPPLHIGNEATQLLAKHTWRGNSRELRNVMARAAVLADGNTIESEHLPYELQKQNREADGNLTLASVEQQHIEKVLRYTRGNKTKAAECLGIGLTTLYRKMEEYGLAK